MRGGYQRALPFVRSVSEKLYDCICICVFVFYAFVVVFVLNLNLHISLTLTYILNLNLHISSSYHPAVQSAEDSTRCPPPSPLRQECQWEAPRSGCSVTLCCHLDPSPQLAFDPIFTVFPTHFTTHWTLDTDSGQSGLFWSIFFGPNWRSDIHHLCTTI